MAANMSDQMSGGDHVTQSHDTHNEFANEISDHHTKLYFSAGFSEQLFVQQWVTTNATELGFACMYVGLMAIAHEAFKLVKDLLLGCQVKLDKITTRENIWKAVCLHIVQTLLYMIQVLLSLLIMLVFMTFNVYLCSAVILGAGCGHFLFRWSKRDGWNSAKNVDENHCG